MAMKPYSSARDEYQSQDDDLVFLDANENPFQSELNRYPDPQQLLLKAKFAALKGVSANQILLGNGSDEVLDLLFRAFCEPHQDAVLTLTPTYGMYGVLAHLNAIENQTVTLTPDFQIPTEKVLEAIQPNTKIIFICSPNNPSGNLLKSDAIERILKSFNGLVVIDEAYIDFTASTSWIAHLLEFPNLVVTQTLSKANHSGRKLVFADSSVSTITIPDTAAGTADVGVAYTIINAGTAALTINRETNGALSKLVLGDPPSSETTLTLSQGAVAEFVCTAENVYSCFGSGIT